MSSHYINGGVKSTHEYDSVNLYHVGIEGLNAHTTRLLAGLWGFNGLAVCCCDTASWTTWPVGVNKITSYLHIFFILTFIGHALWRMHNPAGHASQ
jgi:hypothetical protein